MSNYTGMTCLLIIILVSVSLATCQNQQQAATQDNGAETDTGTMSSAGTMMGARAAHTATVLQDGRVLLAGGLTDSENTRSSAEIYDPAAGTFTLAGPMHIPRQSHTATMLPDGKILLAGGYNSQGEYLASAEIFDPETDMFTPTGSMQSARAGHVVAHLPDDRVLLVGGVGTGWTFLSSAEVYDPGTGTFSATGAMDNPRESHVAVRMRDGRVLIIGGHRGRRADIHLYTSVEIYNPAAGTFRSAGDMVVRRHKHDAVRLPDGRVLITGGTDERDYGGRYTSAEIFDPARETSSEIGTMRLPRYKHAGTSIVMPDGRVLIAGGTTEAEVYDPKTGAFLLVKSQAQMAGQFSAAALLPDGRVLVTGGYGRDRPPQSGAWLYHP